MTYKFFLEQEASLNDMKLHKNTFIHQIKMKQETN